MRVSVSNFIRIFIHVGRVQNGAGFSMITRFFSIMGTRLQLKVFLCDQDSSVEFKDSCLFQGEKIKKQYHVCLNAVVVNVDKDDEEFSRYLGSNIKVVVRGYRPNINFEVRGLKKNENLKNQIPELLNFTNAKIATEFEKKGVLKVGTGNNMRSVNPESTGTYVTKMQMSENEGEMQEETTDSILEKKKREESHNAELCKRIRMCLEKKIFPAHDNLYRIADGDEMQVGQNLLVADDRNFYYGISPYFPDGSINPDGIAPSLNLNVGTGKETSAAEESKPQLPTISCCIHNTNEVALARRAMSEFLLRNRLTYNTVTERWKLVGTKEPSWGSRVSSEVESVLMAKVKTQKIMPQFITLSPTELDHFSVNSGDYALLKQNYYKTNGRQNVSLIRKTANISRPADGTFVSDEILEYSSAEILVIYQEYKKLRFETIFSIETNNIQIVKIRGMIEFHVKDADLSVLDH